MSCGMLVVCMCFYCLVYVGCEIHVPYTCRYALMCITCDYIISAQVSMTFDPFMSLSVPIPRNLRHLPVIFVPQDPSVMPIEVGV